MNTSKITCMHKVIRRVAAGDQFADLLPLIELDPPAKWDACRDMITGAQLVAVGENRSQLLRELNTVERWVDEQRAGAKVAEVKVEATASNQEVITWHDASESLPKECVGVLVRCSSNIPFYVGYHQDGYWWYWNSSGADVTHWADMPAGPEVAS